MWVRGEGDGALVFMEMFGFELLIFKMEVVAGAKETMSRTFSVYLFERIQ